MQSYTEIPSSQSLQSSLALLLNNDKTGLSNSSGTAFPTTNLQVGMLCFRTDQNKLYQLKDAAPTWVVIADLNGSFRHLDGGSGNCIGYSGGDLNSWTSMPSGFYDGSSMLNAPSADWFRVLHLRHNNSSGYSSQLAFPFHQDGLWMRRQTGGTWTAWQKVWTNANDGAGSGLDADLLDGMQSGNAANNIPISNGTVNTNLNADLLDGRHAGNVNGDIPIANGSVCANLNADLLDGYHSTSFVRTVQGISPDASGNVGGLVPLTGATMSGALLTTSYLQSQRGTDPMLEVHKPGVIAGGLMITGDNRLSLVQSNGGGSWAATRFSVDLSSAGNAYVNGRTVWDSGNIGTPLNAVGNTTSRSGSGNYMQSSTTSLVRSGNSVNLNTHIVYAVNCANCNCGNCS